MKNRLNQYLKLNRNSMLYIYKAEYPESYMYDYDILVRKSDRELSKILVSLENNEKSTRHHENTFGFQPLKHISLFTPMGTFLTTFLNGCNI
jgi:hypothetical protein